MDLLNENNFINLFISWMLHTINDRFKKSEILLSDLKNIFSTLIAILKAINTVVAFLTLHET